MNICMMANAKPDNAEFIGVVRVMCFRIFPAHKAGKAFYAAISEGVGNRRVRRTPARVVMAVAGYCLRPPRQECVSLLVCLPSRNTTLAA